MRLKLGWVFLACALLGALPAAAQSTIWVGPDGSDTEGCGAASGSACLTIQYAVNAATDGDTVRVLPGTYNECVDASFKALDIVANAILVDPPSRTVTIIDGWGVCGGLACSYSETARCWTSDECAGTCDDGVCSNSEEGCETDDDCAYSCVSLGLETAPAVQLGPGSTLTGFTVTGAGYGGVAAEGTVTIERNLIEKNVGGWGGGIMAQVYPSVPTTRTLSDPLRCFDDATLTCEGDGDCSVCDNDHTTVCATAEDCTDGAECVGLGPCLTVGELVIDQNIIRDNISQNFGGGVFAWPLASDNAGARVVVTSNTISGNVALNGDGGGVFLQNFSYGGAVESEISGNTVSGNVAEYYDYYTGNGGGIAAKSLVWDYPGRSSVVITQNVVDGNSGYNEGGGIRAESGTFFYYNGSFIGAYGDDSLRVTDNDVTANYAWWGGGVSGWMGFYTYYYSTQSLSIDGNTVSDNEAFLGGGVMSFLQNAGYYYGGGGEFLTADNTISGNSAIYGGGLAAWNYGDFSSGEIVDFSVSGNTISGNTAEWAGGGAFLFSDASYADTYVDFDHNLVGSNVAHDSEGGMAVGGGIFALAGSEGGDPGFAEIDIDYVTAMNNSADLGGGALEIESMTNGELLAVVYVYDSIAANNTGYAVGGPIPGEPGNVTEGGTGDLYVFAGFSDAYGNSLGVFERTLQPVLSAEGIIEENPLLSTAGVPNICSLTIDAGHPEADFSAEPEPNGNRVNQGHLGATEHAVTSLPDVNGDRQISGADVIEITTAFGAMGEDVRWFAAADLDQNGVIDGDDLSYVASKWGTDCR